MLTSLPEKEKVLKIQSLTAKIIWDVYIGGEHNTIKNRLLHDALSF